MSTAAGGHHLLLVGRPRTGATLYARLIRHLLPPLTREQALEITTIQSLAGHLMPDAPLTARAPFIAPHYSTSLLALIGGVAKPGAVRQAHHGILFLDDACEFDRNRLDAVRAALEDGGVRLAHRDGLARYPARFQLLLATAPCPCRQSEQYCACSPHARRRFLARIAGPLLARVDLRVRLHTADGRIPSTLTPDNAPTVRTRVDKARSHAAQRWEAPTPMFLTPSSAGPSSSCPGR